MMSRLHPLPRFLAMLTASMAAFLLAALSVAAPRATAAITLTKQVDRGVAAPGDVITYTLTLTNTSGANQSNVIVQDPFNTTGPPYPVQFVTGSPTVTDNATGMTVPAAMQYQVAVNGAYVAYNPAALPSGPPNNSNVAVDPTVTGVQWTVASLPNGDSYTYQFQVYVPYQATYPGNVTNQATAALTGPSNGGFQPLVIAPTALNFGTIPPNDNRSATFQITNVSGHTVNGTVGAPAAPFAVTSGGGNYSLAPGQTQTVVVTFAPTQANTYNGGLVVTSTDAAQPPVMVTLTGQAANGAAQPAPLTVTPQTYNFGNVATGDNRSKVVAITNVSGRNVQVTVGTLAAPYAVASGGGTLTLAPGQTQNVVVTYAPTAANTDNATLNITSTDAAQPAVNLNLTGTGVTGGTFQAPLTVSPTSVTFPTTTVGQDRSAVITLANNSGHTVTGNIGGLNAPFGIVSGGGAYTLAPGQSQTIVVTYAPNRAGPSNDTVNITSTDPNQPAINVPVRGTANQGAGAGQITRAQSNPVSTIIWPLSLSKSVDKTTAGPGSFLNYTLNFAEAPNINATAVVIRDRIPAGTALVSTAPVTVGGNTYTPEYSTNNGVTWSPIAPANLTTVTDVRWVITGGMTGGTSGSATFRVQIDPNAPVGTVIRNQGFEDSTIAVIDPNTGQNYTTPPGGYPSNEVDTVVEFTTQVKTVDKTVAIPGEELQYRVVVSNDSQQTLTNVVVQDTVPANTFLVAGTVFPAPTAGVVVEYSVNGGPFSTTPPAPDANGVVSSGTVTIRWTFASVPPGPVNGTPNPMAVGFRARVYDATDPGVAPPPGTRITNRAFVTADQNKGRVLQSNPVATTVSDYIGRKTVNRTTAYAGDILTYRVNFENHGPATDVYPLTVVDPIPTNTAFVVGSVEAPSDLLNGAPVGNNQGNTIQYSNDGGLTWAYTPTANSNGVDPAVTDIRVLVDTTKAAITPGPFVPGESGLFTFQVQVNTTDPNATPPTSAPPSGTTIRNQAYLDFDLGGPRNDILEQPTNVATTVISPLLITKTVDKSAVVLPAGGGGTNGAILTYTVTAQNIIQSDDPNTSQPLTNVTVSDAIPGGTQYIAGSANTLPAGVTVALSSDGGATYNYTSNVANGQADPNVTDIQWTFATLSPYQSSGNSVTFKVQVVPPAGNTNGVNLQIANIASGFATYQQQGNPTPAAEQVGPVDSNETLSSVTTVYFQKLVNRPLYIPPGDTITYTFLFQNFGAQSLNNVLINDTLPASLKILTATSSGTPAPTITVDAATNTARFQWTQAIPQNAPIRLTIQALVSSQLPLGTEIDNAGQLSFSGLTELFDSNTVTNFVIGNAGGTSPFDWLMFQHDQDHHGLDTEQGTTPLDQVWTFNGASQDGASFIASPVVARGVPLQDIGDNQNPNSPDIERRTVEYIGATDGYMHAIEADNGVAIWDVQYEQPIFATGAIAVGPIGATATVVNGQVTGVNYQHQNRTLLVFGLGSTANPGQPGAVVCLDASTGDEVWRFDGLNGAVIGSPIIVPNVPAHLLFRNPALPYRALPFQTTINLVVVPCSDGHLYAFNLSGDTLPGTTNIEPQVVWVTKGLSGLNESSPGALGTSGIVFVDQRPVTNRNDLFDDYLHAVTSDATSNGTGFPLDANGNPANPFQVSAGGAGNPDYPVPADLPGWANGLSQNPISTRPDNSYMTQSPLVDADSPAGPVIHIACQNRLVALNSANGAQLATFGINGGITSTPALARLPSTTNVTAAPTSMVYFSANDRVGTGNTFRNSLYALTFDQNGYTKTWNTDPVDLDGPIGAPTHTGIPTLTSSVATAVDPNGGGMVFVATSSGSAKGGAVLSFNAATGALTGPLAGPQPYVFQSALNDNNPNAQASLAVTTVPVQNSQLLTSQTLQLGNGPWVFGATIGGTAFALGTNFGLAGGVGPPGVLVQKFLRNISAASANPARGSRPFKMGDRIDYTVVAYNPGYSPRTARQQHKRYEPLFGLVIVDNVPAGTSYVYGSATPLLVPDFNQPGTPLRWVIPQLVQDPISRRVLQVVWDFRNTIDIYGLRLGPGESPDPTYIDYTASATGNPGPAAPPGWLGLAGGETIRAGFAVTVDSKVTATNGGAPVTLLTPGANGALQPAGNTFQYGQQIYARASGLMVDVAALNDMPDIQNTAAVYATNALTPDDPQAATILDPDGPTLVTPAMPIGGLIQPPPPSLPLPPLGRFPASVPENRIAPYPTNPPQGNRKYYTPGLHPIPLSGGPEFYATGAIPVDKNPANAPVYFRLMRFNPAQPFFIPANETDLQKDELVWEPADQRLDRGGPGYIIEGQLLGPVGTDPNTGNPLFNVEPGLSNPGPRGTPLPVYTIDTRNPNLYHAGNSGNTQRNGALSPSPVLPNESYTLELWSTARPSNGSPNMGFLGASNFFGVLNPVAVVAEAAPPVALPTGERPDTNGNAMTAGTVMDTGATAHGHTSPQTTYWMWDNSWLYLLKPSGPNATKYARYRGFSDLKIRVTTPDKVLPQAGALHLNPTPTGGGVAPLVNEPFNPNPNWHPNIWANALFKQAAQEDPIENVAVNGDMLPNGQLQAAGTHGHRLRDGYSDMMMNGLSTNQYHWSATLNQYWYDANAKDPIIPGGHYETFTALATQLNASLQQAQQRFDQDYPGISEHNERWTAAGVDPTIATATLPNAVPGSARPNSVSGYFSVSVPKYQPDDDLTAPLGTGHNPTAAQANHHYGYLGRAYVFLDAIGDGALHVFDPVLASPRAYGYQKKYPNQANPITPPPVKDDTYEDAYRTVDAMTEVGADLNFRNSQVALNLKQFPHGSSDLAQQASAPLGTGDWSPIDIQNDGNVNLVALAPWHYDNTAGKWRILGNVFNSTQPFFSDNLFGVSAGRQPIDPHVYLPRTMIWWSTRPRTATNAGPFGARAIAGKLPKAEAGAPFPTKLSGNPADNGFFQPWIGIDIPVGQPVGTYENKTLLREPTPNYEVFNGNLQPPDLVPNPNVIAPSDVDSLNVLHPTTASVPLDLTVDVEEAEPAITAMLPTFFNQYGFTTIGTTNDPRGNDDSPAFTVESLPPGAAPASVTTAGSQLSLYWASNRNGANAPLVLADLYLSRLTIPYDVNTGTFASTFGPAASALWSRAAGPLLSGGPATTYPARSNAASLGMAPDAVNGPGYLIGSQSDGSIWGMTPPAGPATPALLEAADPYNQGPRLLYRGLNGPITVQGAVTFGNPNGSYLLRFVPLPGGTGYTLSTPTALSNAQDPSVAFLPFGMNHQEQGTIYHDYEVVGYTGTSRLDHTNSIYASRFGRLNMGLNPNGPAEPPLPFVDTATNSSGTSWPRIGLSVRLRYNAFAADPAHADNRHGETLLPDASGMGFYSQHLQWATPMPPRFFAGEYPAPTANAGYYVNWPQILAYDPDANTVTGAYTPPLNMNNHWVQDTANNVWMLQAANGQLVLTLDPNSGLVRFPAAPMVRPGKVASIRADYTPGTLRLSRGSSSDYSPSILVDDSPDNLAHPTQPDTTQPVIWNVVSRHTLWTVWRRQTSQITTQPASTLYYTGWRLQVDLPAGVALQNNPATMLPDIQVYYYGGPGTLGSKVPNTLWGIDPIHNRLWFDGSLENQDVTVVENNLSGNPVRTDATVSWEQAAPETPLRIQGISSEGQPSLFLETVLEPLFDPTYSLPLDGTGRPTTANVTPFGYTYRKLWVFWSSTRTPAPGIPSQTDILYESIVPQL